MAIHEAIDKADGIVFRCTLSGSAADRWLEVPAWMFDRARCLDPPRLTASLRAPLQLPTTDAPALHSLPVARFAERHRSYSPSVPQWLAPWQTTLRLPP